MRTKRRQRRGHGEDSGRDPCMGKGRCERKMSVRRTWSEERMRDENGWGKKRHSWVAEGRQRMQGATSVLLGPRWPCLGWKREAGVEGFLSGKSQPFVLVAGESEEWRTREWWERKRGKRRPRRRSQQRHVRLPLTQTPNFTYPSLDNPVITPF